jgi:hypothetical protein
MIAGPREISNPIILSLSVLKLVSGMDRNLAIAKEVNILHSSPGCILMLPSEIQDRLPFTSTPINKVSMSNAIPVAYPRNAVDEKNLLSVSKMSIPTNKE